MKTDSIFYRLFQIYPAALFELLGQPIENAQDYRFLAVEVKQLAFRLDGVFSSDLPINPIYFMEVQFQRDERFYARTFSEIFLYLGENGSEREWQFVILFAKRSIAPPLPAAYRLLLPNIKIIYLDELSGAKDQSLGIQIMSLVVCSSSEAKIKVPNLLSTARNLEEEALQNEMIDLIKKILIYKFDKLNREELEAMFGLSELKQTRFYLEALEEGKEDGIQLGKQVGVQEGIQLGKQVGVQEGIQLGKQVGESRLVLRLLTKKFGELGKIEQRIAFLSSEQLEALGDALLDFAKIDDLENWLKANK